MRRRDFLATGAAAGAGALLGGTEAALGKEVAGTQEPLPAPIAALRSRAGAAPAPISEEERAARRARAQQLLAAAGLDALFVEPGPTLTYFADVRWGRSERVFGMLLPRAGEPVFICPAFEAGRAAQRIGGRFAVRTWQEDENPFALIAASVRDAGSRAGTIAVDGSSRYFVAHGLAEAGSGLDVACGDGVVRACRGVKDAHELEILRFANRVTLEGLDAVFRSLRAGLTQRDLGRLVAQAFERLGFQGGGLTLIGESSAHPHGVENPRPLRPGDVVLIDAGLAVHGYVSDITRTVAFGHATPEVQRVYDVVRRAQLAALEAARPGALAGDVDAAARRVLADAGFGAGYEYLTHRLGHGIGLEGHEWPYFVRGSRVALEPGMTLSNEPGIYQVGKFGVRTEDILEVTDDGAALMTGPEMALRVIPDPSVG